MPSLNAVRGRALSIAAAALFVLLSARLIAHDRRFASWSRSCWSGSRCRSARAPAHASAPPVG